MNEAFWLALVFGWPGPFLAGFSSAAAIIFHRPRWFVAASILLIPFSIYVAGHPATWCFVLLPGLPLIAAAFAKRAKWAMAWVATAALALILNWLALTVRNSNNELNRIRQARPGQATP